MRNTIILVVLMAVVIVAFGLSTVFYINKASILEHALSVATLKGSPEWLSNHQREVWVTVLEWCESRGIPSAINPFDSDGTPSFGGFQFKPGTFRAYQEKYGIPGNLMDYEAQRAILLRMLDDPDMKWEGEFPACIKKFGYPPQKF